MLDEVLLLETIANEQVRLGVGKALLQECVVLHQVYGVKVADVRYRGQIIFQVAQVYQLRQTVVLCELEHFLLGCGALV